MAIRIAGKARPEAPVPETPEMPEEMAQEPEVEQESEVPTAPAKFSADKVDPRIARYMTSDMGPFICANCDHFTEEGECEVVSGPIDPEGVCILFTPGIAPAEPMEVPEEPESEALEPEEVDESPE